jgi:hypothetical protein
MRCATGHCVRGCAGLWWKRIQIDGIPRIVGHGGVTGGLLDDGRESVFERSVAMRQSRDVLVFGVAALSTVVQ